MYSSKRIIIRGEGSESVYCSVSAIYSYCFLRSRPVAFVWTNAHSDIETIRIKRDANAPKISPRLLFPILSTFQAVASVRRAVVHSVRFTVGVLHIRKLIRALCVVAGADAAVGSNANASWPGAEVIADGFIALRP